MQNGAKVKWKSHTGKVRTGIYICDFLTVKLSMVIGEWDGKVHKIQKSRLQLVKRSQEEAPK